MPSGKPEIITERAVAFVRHMAEVEWLKADEIADMLGVTETSVHRAAEMAKVDWSLVRDYQPRVMTDKQLPRMLIDDCLDDFKQLMMEMGC